MTLSELFINVITGAIIGLIGAMLGVPENYAVLFMVAWVIIAR